MNTIMQILLIIVLVWAGLWLAGWLLYSLARICVAISDFLHQPFRNLPK